MTLDPIINAKMERFKKDYLLTDEKEDIVFERFAISNILSLVQPDVFKTDYDLLEQICVDGGEDMGLDGIAISLNGQFIRSCADIDAILEVNKRGKFELYFLQTKNKSKFDLGDYLKFLSGVKSFLKKEISLSCNSSVMKWHEIFEYVYSNEIVENWDGYPIIRWYFVANGIKEDIHHIEEHSKECEKELEEKTNSTVVYSIIDSKQLLDIININENNYKFTMNLVDSMSLPAVPQVNGSRVILCQADDLIKMLSTPDGLLRRSIFEDNVRDYQGDTNVNQDITKTIKNESERFVLLNNGITVVCDEVMETNRKITITNPQVVNGCQTCSVLFQNHEDNVDNVDLSKVYVIIKIIGSTDADIVNSIVKGTNRQNIVYEEAFEITRDFHKKLEEFFRSFSIEGKDKIYYERRSKQFDNTVLIGPFQKVTFRILIQSFVTLFLENPEIGHSHESKLLRSYKNKIFLDNQSFYPYYAAAYIYLFIERTFRAKKTDNDLRTYRMQIMMIFKELIAGESPDINSKKRIESYCFKLFQKLEDDQLCFLTLENSIDLFHSISKDWIAEKGEAFKDSRKDNAEFTRFILTKVRGRDYVVHPAKTIGKVLSVHIDRRGKYYGFIARDPDNIFFHEYDNPNLDFSMNGKWVSYETIETKRGLHAVNVTLEDADEHLT